MTYDQIVTWIENNIAEKDFDKYEDVNKFKEDLNDINLTGSPKQNAEFQRRIGEWKDGTLSSSTSYSSIIENIESKSTKVVDELISLQERGDISGLKSISVRPELEEQKENRMFNAAMSKARELRDTNNVNGLNDLKSQISGIRDETEVINFIDRILARLESEKESEVV